MWASFCFKMDLFYICVYMHVYVNICYMCATVCRKPEEKIGLLLQELLVIMSHRIWVLGQDSGHLEEQHGLLTAMPYLQPLVSSFLGALFYFIGQ